MTAKPVDALLFVLVFFSFVLSACASSEKADAAAQGRETPGSRTAVPPDGSTEIEKPNPTAATASGDRLSAIIDPAEEEPTEYVTHVLTYTGCDDDDETIAVSKGHPFGSSCERIVLVPAMVTQDGDFVEIGAWFDWQAADESLMDFGCFGNPKGRVCWPIMKRDLFDDGTDEEPRSKVTACTTNVCPKKAKDCPKTVCTSLLAFSVVSMEGDWKIETDPPRNPTQMSPTQESRSFSDPVANIKHGRVVGKFVSFDVDDARYEGFFDQDRDHAYGIIRETIGLTQIGTWTASRYPDLPASTSPPPPGFVGRG